MYMYIYTYIYVHIFTSLCKALITLSAHLVFTTYIQAYVHYNFKGQKDIQDIPPNISLYQCVSN